MKKFGRVKTKNDRKMLLYDLIGFSSCYLFVELLSSLFGNPFVITRGIVAIFTATITVLPELHSFSSVIAWFLFMALGLMALFMVVLLFSFPILAIYLGIRSAKKKQLKEDTTYDIVNDITYYRDTFKKVSPATISLLMDLKIEYKKDVSATLLKLYDKKAIGFENDSMVLSVSNQEGLKTSELELLNVVKEGKPSSFSSMNWEKKCIDEAIDDGYIINKRTKGKLLVRMIVLLIGMIVCISLFSTLLLNRTDSLEEIPILEKYTEEEADKLSYQEVLKDPDFVLSVVMLSEFVLGIIAGIGILIIPIYGMAYAAAYNSKKYKLKRTALGNELTEKIVGMKNFIHDFGNLSEVTKEQIIIWNDFLVYAVVLEENEKIVEEIGSFYGVNISDFKIGM